MSEYIPQVSPELLAGFLDEAPEYLSIMDEGLMAFEEKAGTGSLSLEAPEDQARMNEMFRAAHSLKGLGAAMGFDKIRDLTHRMETLFDHVRMGKRQLDPKSIETLFRVFDKLKELVQELSEPPAEPVTINDELAALDSILESPMAGAGSATPSKPVAAVSPAGASSDADVTAAGVAVPAGVDETPTAVSENDSVSDSCGGNMVLDNPELAKLFVDTTLETLDELNETLLKLETSPNDAEQINCVFRCAHNIKGATGAAGCDTLYRLTHSMETLLDLVRSKKLDLSEEMMTVIFEAADRIRSDIHLVRDGRVAELSAEGTKGLFDKWISPKGDTKAAAAQAEPVVPTDPTPEADLQGEIEDGVLVVDVNFGEGNPEAPIQAYLIFNKLKEFGEVLSSSPDVDSLDPMADVVAIRYRVQTTCPSDQIKEAVATYPVKKVSVVGGATSAQSDSDVVEASDAPPAQQKEESQDAKNSAVLPAAMPAKPSATPQAGPATKTAAPSKPQVVTAAEVAKAPPKVGETIRVDLERLDQLMNLGGELVINKARLVQIQSRFHPLFDSQNLGYLVEDMSERLSKLEEGIGALSETAESRYVSELSSATHSLAHDFGAIRGLLAQIHECRPAMNDFSEALHSLNRVSEGIQKRIMETRMVSIGPLFQRFRRVVRDISKATGKNVELVLHGEATELDKRMIDELGDPLTHMIRNSVDHGIEMPDVRVAAGKPAMARVTLNAYHRGRHICIEVKDDGRGVNIEAVRKKILEKQLASATEVERMSEKELVQYIFKPGFSTAEQVTDLSGRGMGMDIVMGKLDAINGTVDVESETGVGCTVTIKLPLTLAIITAIIARIGKSVYAIPLETVAEIITVPQSSIQFIQRRRVVRVRDRVIPVALFEQIFRCGDEALFTKTRKDANITLVILSIQNEKIGLVVDELIGQEDVVIKSISDNYRNVAGITGASIMGDGSVSLILDVASMMSMLTGRSESEINAALEGETVAIESADSFEEEDARAVVA